MRVFRRFPSEHGDFIHDMSFDFYGKRLATCSSDRKIKIWEENGDEWKLQHEWSAHQASVWKVAWAHPEFGQILASCSFDRTVSIWEDQGIYPGHSHTTTISKEGWRNQGQLVDSRESVHDVKFAPRHLGLRLATASEDGFVRMYEAIDVMNLSHWPLQEEFLADKEGVTCISWNKSRFDAPMILVGGNSDVVKVWGYNNNYRRWQIVAELNGHSDSIHDVCWAPNMGRSYHLLATASKDRTFRIWKLKLQEGLLQGEVEEVAKKHHHDSELWRVEWNITGTMLASSGDDGIVRMWKSDHQGNWACVNTICGDLSSNIQTIKASASAAAAANASTEGAAGGSDGTHIVNPIQSLGRGGAGGLSGTTGANARLSGLNLNVPALGGATKGSSSIGGPSGPLGSSTNGQNSLVLPGGINPSGVNPVNAGSVVIGPGGQHHSGPTAAAVTAAATAAVLANMNLNSVNIP